MSVIPMTAGGVLIVLCTFVQASVSQSGTGEHAKVHYRRHDEQRLNLRS